MDNEIVRTDFLGSRKRFTPPAIMRKGWLEGDQLDFIQKHDEPEKIVIENKSYKERLNK